MGFGNMYESKYSKLLTVILVIVILVVIGLLAFFGYDVYKQYYIDKESKDVVSQFEQQLNNNLNQEAVGSVEWNSNILDLNVNLNIIDTNTNNENSSSGGGNSSGGRPNIVYKGYNVIGTIKIPATDIEYPILDQVSIRSLEASIGCIYTTGGGLNTVGNCVLVGHNYRNGTFFSNNKKLQNGDKIYITDLSGKKVTYEVYKKYETSTNDFDYATRDVNGKREISLSTCTDDSKRRVIIWAREQ